MGREWLGFWLSGRWGRWSGRVRLKGSKSAVIVGEKYILLFISKKIETNV
jgi:hypothetical protein